MVLTYFWIIQFLSARRNIGIGLLVISAGLIARQTVKQSRPGSGGYTEVLDVRMTRLPTPQLVVLERVGPSLHSSHHQRGEVKSSRNTQFSPP